MDEFYNSAKYIILTLPNLPKCCLGFDDRGIIRKILLGQIKKSSELPCQKWAVFKASKNVLYQILFIYFCSITEFVQNSFQLPEGCGSNWEKSVTRRCGQARKPNRASPETDCILSPQNFNMYIWTFPTNFFATSSLVCYISQGGIYS